MTETIKVEWKQKNTSTWVDVSSYLVKGGSLSISKGSDKRKGGRVELDTTIPYTITSHDYIKISVSDGSDNRIFEGLFVEETKDADNYVWSYEHYERYTTIRTATNIFTGKTRVEVFKLLVDEYLTEYTYDNNSIPIDADDESKDWRIDGEIISDILNIIAEELGKKWWVDDDKKIFLQELSFAASGYNITANEMLKRPNIQKDIGRWKTKSRVEGEIKESTFQQSFSVSDTGTMSWTLNLSYNAIEVKQIPSGDTEADVAPKRVILEGESADSDSYDFTYNPAQKKITRNTNNITLTVNDTIRVKGTVVSQVVGEAVNPTARAKYGLVEGKPIVNRLVTTDEKAEELAQSEADTFGEPIRVVSFPTVWNSNALPGNSVTVNGYGLNESLNILEMHIEFSGQSAPRFTLTLDNYPYTYEDELDDYQRRLRQEENKNRDAQVLIKKSIFHESNPGIEIYRIKAESEGITNAFTFDITDGNGMFDNVNRYFDGNDGGGALTDEGTVYAYNVNDKIKLFFHENEYWDTANSTATIDTTNARVNF